MTCSKMNSGEVAGDQACVHDAGAETAASTAQRRSQAFSARRAPEESMCSSTSFNDMAAGVPGNRALLIAEMA